MRRISDATVVADPIGSGIKDAGFDELENAAEVLGAPHPVHGSPSLGGEGPVYGAQADEAIFPVGEDGQGEFMGQTVTGDGGISSPDEGVEGVGTMNPANPPLP